MLFSGNKSARTTKISWQGKGLILSEFFSNCKGRIFLGKMLKQNLCFLLVYLIFVIISEHIISSPTFLFYINTNNLRQSFSLKICFVQPLRNVSFANSLSYNEWLISSTRNIAPLLLFSTRF